MAVPNWAADIGAFRNGNHKSVLKKIEIQNFLLMAAHLGLINKIYWIAPPWCHNYSFGHLEIELGIGERYGSIYVTAKEQDQEVVRYWTGPQLGQSGNFVPWSERDSLRNFRTVHFRMVKDVEMTRVLKGAIDSRDDVLLDVDEDYFATESVFAQRFRAQTGVTQAALEEMYALQMYPAERDTGPNAPEDLARHFGSKVARLLDQLLIDGAVYDRLNNILAPFADGVRAPQKRDKNRELPGYNLLHALNLPCHYSDHDEVERRADAMRERMSQVVQPSQVKFITLCRSPTYTPNEIMPVVECTALSRLRAMFETSTVHMEDEDAARIVCGDSHAAHTMEVAVRTDPSELAHHDNYRRKRGPGAEVSPESGSGTLMYTTAGAAIAAVAAAIYISLPKPRSRAAGQGQDDWTASVTRGKRSGSKSKGKLKLKPKLKKRPTG
eukprot:g5679.t1